MAEEFKDQGGASSSNPPAAVRWLMSRVLTRRMAPESVASRRDTFERKRRAAGTPHRVEYFHQVEDGYSHLAAQLLRPLVDHYDVDLVCHVVRVEHDRNLPEPDLLLPLSRVDSAAVAPHYGLRFPSGAAAPQRDLVELAERILTATDAKDFPEVSVAVGDALWSGDRDGLAELEKRHGSSDAALAEAQIAEAIARRGKLGHYSGAMFLYGNEWYWGADRFYHLENRLKAVGARRDAGEELLCARPAIENGPLKDDGSLTLEIYPSLRSPYTSMIFDTAVELARETGVKPVIRPVLPMVMRGVPATRLKGMYIFSDCAREAAALGLDWGNVYDPIGEPARNGYALYAWACKHGRGTELLSSFLRAAFFEGVNTNRPSGLQRVVEGAGLNWDEARAALGSREWETELEGNRLEMYGFGSWGVPSFRLLDARQDAVLAVWGQDRLWLVSREIQRLLREVAGG
jgi:2-hydroxychromene-2-carboxylate isomerase